MVHFSLEYRAAAALQHQGKYELSTDPSKIPGTCRPHKVHRAIQESSAPPGEGFLCSLWNTLRKWKFRCAQGASCQLRFVHHISAGEDCAQVVPCEAVENSFSENGFPHYCVSSFCSHSALSSGLKGNSGLHFGG